MYTIKLSHGEELPVSYTNLIKCFCDVGKLFKRSNIKFLLVYENDKLLKKLVNPRFRKVDKETFFSGFYEEGFIIKDQVEEYYINN
jgi:hypothetical protein